MANFTLYLQLTEIKESFVDIEADTLEEALCEFTENLNNYNHYDDLDWEEKTDSGVVVVEVNDGTAYVSTDTMKELGYTKLDVDLADHPRQVQMAMTQKHAEHLAKETAPIAQSESPDNRRL